MGRIEAWRRRLEVKAAQRQRRFRELDGELREAVEKREIPRPAKHPLPEPGSLPDDVAALVDDGQVQRAVYMLANLTHREHHEAEHAVALYLHERHGHPPPT